MYYKEERTNCFSTVNRHQYADGREVFNFCANFSPEMPIDWRKVIFKGLVIKGVYSRKMFETGYKRAALIQSGLDLEPLITHR